MAVMPNWCFKCAHRLHILEGISVAFTLQKECYPQCERVNSQGSMAVQLVFNCSYYKYLNQHRYFWNATCDNECAACTNGHLSRNMYADPCTAGVIWSVMLQVTWPFTQTTTSAHIPPCKQRCSKLLTREHWFHELANKGRAFTVTGLERRLHVEGFDW